MHRVYHITAEFVRLAFVAAGLDVETVTLISDATFLRPSVLDTLHGFLGLSRRCIGWKAQVVTG